MTTESDKPVVLVIDDDRALREAMAKALGEHYIVHSADSGAHGLAALREFRVELILLDIGLPDMSGVDVVPQALEADPDVAVLMVTACDDAATAAQCMQLGAVDYLTKPFELNDVLRAVRMALRRRSTQLENRKMGQWLTEEVSRLTCDVRREQERNQQLTLTTLEALVTALEAKDPYARGHSARIADLAVTVADRLGLSDEEIEVLRTAGRLHDVGNIGIRESVLHKPGALTNEEFEHVKQHVVIGVRILAPIKTLTPVVELVRYHHERWDGKGYPDGIAGDAIPLGARILAAAEVYDALTSTRPYQATLSAEEARTRIHEISGHALDPAISDALTLVTKRRQTLSFVVEAIRDA
jgi:putative two-component system response regulator